jgi:hypothetical protein
MRARDLPGTCVNTGALGWVVGAQVFPPSGDSTRDANRKCLWGLRASSCADARRTLHAGTGRAIPRTWESNSTDLREQFHVLESAARQNT